MKILNLGCGTKTSDRPGVINIDWSIYFRVKKMWVLRPIASLFFQGKRLEKFHSIPSNVMAHNLKKGIPFSSDSVDVVYHSHFLEHLDKDVAEKFLIEVKRVLKDGGIHRIVVPDLETASKAYLAHIVACKNNPSETANHDLYVAALIEMFVRKEAFGTSKQTRLRRYFENFILGGAKRRGETHQWMYDRINLKSKLFHIGYKKVFVQKFNTSLIIDWSDYGLDVDNDGNQYKPDSLYIEAVK